MYSVQSGEIIEGVSYLVVGDQSVIYNENTIIKGAIFKGVKGIIEFEFIGSGTQELFEVVEINDGGIEFATDLQNHHFLNETVELKGMAIEFEPTNTEKILFETPAIMMGMSIEINDYPYYYSFEITETRL